MKFNFFCVVGHSLTVLLSSTECPSYSPVCPIRRVTVSYANPSFVRSTKHPINYKPKKFVNWMINECVNNQLKVHTLLYLKRFGEEAK